MQSSSFLPNVIFVLLFVSLAACVPVQEQRPILPTITPAPPGNTPVQQTATVPHTNDQILVAYVRDGNVHLWDSSTNLSQNVFSSGDVLHAEISEDGQVIAFQRIVAGSQPVVGASSSLWVVDRNGGTGREVVSADMFRQRLNANINEDTGIAEMTWIPGTHRLIYSGTKGNAAASENRKAEDVYLVDTDTLHDMLISPAGNGWRVSGTFDGRQFVPSPDGAQIAVLSGTELNLVNSDGSNLRQNFFTYPQSGAGDVPFVPTGIWTQDGFSLIVNAPMENDPSAQGASYSITRVPVDGSPVERIATVKDAPPVFFTFAPAGDRMGYRSIPGSEPTWQIRPLALRARPLAIPLEYSTNLFWSPAGDAYFLDHQLIQPLCPDATSNSNVCGTAIVAPGDMLTLYWLDGNRFVGLTSNPAVLFLGNRDGTVTAIASWPPEFFARGLSVAVIP